MDNMNKGIKFDFSKTEVITNKLRWIKTLKEVFCINLRDAKDAVDCGSYFYDFYKLMNPLNKSSLKCLLYVLLLLVVVAGGIYTIAITGELIITSLGMGVILGLFFILINKESQRIEKYLYEEEQKQQDL